MAPHRGKSAPFPSKAEIRRFIEESEGRVGKREIARAFRISGNDRIALKKIIRELEDDGALQRSGRRRMVAAGRLPPVTVVEITDIDVDGELRAQPVRAEDGEKPFTIFVLPQVRGVATLGVGDRVLARLTRSSDGSYEAKPIRVLDARRTQLVGVYRVHPGGGGRIHPTDRRARNDYVVDAGERIQAEDGELVLAEAVEGRAHGLPRARVRERLGPMEAPSAISLLAIHSHGIPVDFSKEALALADKAKPPQPGRRVDLRALPLVTIDGADARDFDDAVWAERDGKDGWHIVVAIADVAHYVRPGDALDKDARERGNSVYFPDRVVPMLPEGLSNGLCSLRPGEDRACIAAHIWLNADGEINRHRFERALMRSAARLTYDQVEDAHQGRLDDTTRPLMADLITPLYGAYEALRKANDARGALDLDLPERRIVLADDGTVESIGLAPRFDSHRLIEMFMIAANVAAAETLEAKKKPCMYRVHDQPSMAKLEALREFLSGIGYKLTRDRQVRATNFNQILAKAADTPQSHIVSLVVLRAQARAEYNPENIGHFGLGLRRYAHFTSPIRRYADLLVHRAIIDAMGFGKDGLPADAEESFKDTAEHISRTERRAQLAERDASERYATLFMAAHVGAEFEGRINGVTRFGVFVSLDETQAEGLIPASTLGTGRPHHDAERHRLVIDGRAIELGQTVTVQLMEAQNVTGGLLFALEAVGGKPWTPGAPKGSGAKATYRRGPRGRKRSSRG